jgi:hypothetical protein
MVQTVYTVFLTCRHRIRAYLFIYYRSVYLNSRVSSPGMTDDSMHANMQRQHFS